ncbi:MAG: ROK family protein [Prevotella sp.]|nr:ROK family protein [Prevotella sp.]
MIEGTIKSRVVGVGLSVERTVFAIVDMRGTIIAKSEFHTTDYPNPNEYAAHLSESILQLAEENGGYETIRSVGFSAPSGNFKTGCIEYPPNLPWKGSTPMAAMLRDRLGLAVALGNNAHVRALGEYVYGSAHGLRDFIFLNVGHGVGSAIFSGGKFYLGSDGFSGEIGHTCVEHNGRTCGCGNRGCLEAYVGTKGILRTAQELLERDPRPSLMRERVIKSPRDIYHCCEEGDELAVLVFHETGLRLGIGMANYASILNPEAIVLAGGIAHAGKWLFEPTSQSFEEHVFHNIKGKVKLLPSILNDDERDVLGAGALAWEVKEYSLFI